VTVEHPSIDTIADYCAQLLPADAAEAMATHLSQCSVCADEAASVEAVSAVLAGEARRPLKMPEPVQRAIDDALRAERSATVVPLVPGTSRRTPSGLGRVRRPLLSAAAAVIAVAGVTGVVRLVQGTGNEQPQTASTAPPARAAGASAVSPSPPSSTNGHQPGRTSQGLSPRFLRSYAEKLTDDFTKGRAVEKPDDARKSLKGCAAPDVPATDIVTVRRWLGMQAIVGIDPMNRRAYVLDCHTPAKELYHTHY
jgi:hypothetical protein